MISGQRDQCTLRHVSIPGDAQTFRRITEDILCRASALGYGQDTIFCINLAVEEALVNAFRHGNCKDPAKRIDITYAISGQRIFIRVRDEGEGFDPEHVPDPTDEKNLDKPCGRGILLMRECMDRISYNQTGNEVYMVVESSAAPLFQTTGAPGGIAASRREPVCALNGQERGTYADQLLAEPPLVGECR